MFRTVPSSDVGRVAEVNSFALIELSLFSSSSLTTNESEPDDAAKLTSTFVISLRYPLVVYAAPTVAPASDVPVAKVKYRIRSCRCSITSCTLTPNCELVSHSNVELNGISCS